MKARLLCLLLAQGTPHAHPSTDLVVAARAQAMQSMQTFNPQAVIPKFTSSPRESSLQPNLSDNDTLLQQEASSRLNQDDTARFVMAEEQRRVKITQNPTEISACDNLIQRIDGQTPVVGCADGRCDLSATDVSDDINEAVSRFATLSGTAEEVAVNQAHSNQAAIFRGVYQECKQYLFGVRDCCTDSGSLGWLIHCPSQLQALQKAKLEQRAVYLGRYKPHRFSAMRYGYCVFPTKLAGIVQIQGRFAQLGIGFGNVWQPICRGVTPEELERINFAALDLRAMVAELVGKKTLPQAASMDAFAVLQVNTMHHQGRAHD